MATARITPIKETTTELRTLLKTSIPMFQPRIRLLMVIKKYGANPVSKRALMEETGYSSDSVHNWRSLYAKGGIEALLTHKKIGFKKSIISKENHEKLAAKLKDPENGIQGYKELNEWVLAEFKTEISYNTLLKYCVRHFGSKVKVARKYHAQKDVTLENSFKKTSLKSAKKR
jgi:transposase